VVYERVKPTLMAKVNENAEIGMETEDISKTICLSVVWN
jgi:hypothetical protein